MFSTLDRAESTNGFLTYAETSLAQGSSLSLQGGAWPREVAAGSQSSKQPQAGEARAREQPLISGEGSTDFLHSEAALQPL